MKVLLVAGLADSLINFRGPLIAALRAKDFVVHVAAPDLSTDSTVRNRLESLGLTVHQIPMSRVGTNPLADFRTILVLWHLIRKIAPGMVLCYTVKPVIYGSLASWLAGVPRRFALITGQGYALQGRADARGGLRALVQRLYSLALRRTHKVFFQNPDDQALFRSLGLLPSCTPSCVVNGSGVDVAAFAVAPVPPRPHFLLIARLLGDKGVREYAQAAQRTLALYPQARFSLVGWLDENPDAIAQSELDAWVQAGTLDFLGRLSDVRPAIEACSVYVLPSYGEGTPRTVLEAMAMGRAVITTDAPGCRGTVVDGENGFLVPVQSVDALVEAMARFITDPTLAVRMGQRGRQLAEDKYDVHKVNTMLLKEMGLG
jgi:glycosyltransferase involved in cell wall biosynthesis